MKKYIQPESELLKFTLSSLLNDSLRLIDDEVTAEEDDEVLTQRFDWEEIEEENPKIRNYHPIHD